MIETKVGLPNTCSVCGTPQREFWYAEHEDAARSGQGLCRECAFPIAQEDVSEEEAARLAEEEEAARLAALENPAEPEAEKPKQAPRHRKKADS